MTYVVVINMDYDNHPQSEVTELWSEIKQRMLDAGFIRDGRTFAIHRPAREACRVARGVIEALASGRDFQHQHLHRYLKDFYGYDLACTTNLMLPPTEQIRIEQEITPG